MTKKKSVVFLLFIIFVFKSLFRKDCFGIADTLATF